MTYMYNDTSNAVPQSLSQICTPSHLDSQQAEIYMLPQLLHSIPLVSSLTWVLCRLLAVFCWLPVMLKYMYSGPVNKNMVIEYNTHLTFSENESVHEI